MTEYIPWGIVVATSMSIWLVGRSHRAGLLVAFAAQVLWFVFYYHVGAYVLMPLAVALGALAIRDWRRWGRLGIGF